MSFRCSTFVTIATFKNSFFIENLYYLIPIVQISNFEFKKKNQIPFFGMSNVPVSVVPPPRMGLKERGIRLSSGFPNSVSVDFQCLNTNVNVKISSSKECNSKFQITGTKSMESSMEVIKQLVYYLQITDYVWFPFFQLSTQERYNIMCEFLLKLQIDNDGLIKYTDSKILSIIDEFSNKYSSIQFIFDFIARYTMEFNSFKLMAEAMLRLISLKSGSNSMFHNQNSFIFDNLCPGLGLYNANIGQNNLCLSYIANILVQNIELTNDLYNIRFHNINQDKIKLMAPIRGEIQRDKIKRGNKLVTYSFEISDTGSIRLFCGASIENALNEGKRIFNLIYEICNSENYKKYVNADTYEPDFLLNNFNENELLTEEDENTYLSSFDIM